MIWRRAVVGAAGVVGLLIASVGLSSGVATACVSGQIDLVKLTADTAPIQGYSGVELQNAATIMNTATDLKIDARGQAIGVMVAIGRSGLQNLDHGTAGDPGRLGIYQLGERWGSDADRMSTETASRLFFAHLTAVSGWETRAPSEVANTALGDDADGDLSTYFAPAAAIVQGIASRAGAGSCAGQTHSPGDDYPWSDQKTIKEGGGLSPLGYYYRECTDFVAWRLNRDAGDSAGPWKYRWSNLTPLGGNAIDWKANWALHGWTVTDQPQPGAVAWWGKSGGRQGHVAYVQSVGTDGSVSVEEYNWGGRHLYETRNVTASGPDAFLLPPRSG